MLKADPTVDADTRLRARVLLEKDSRETDANRLIAQKGNPEDFGVFSGFESEASAMPRQPYYDFSADGKVVLLVPPSGL